VRIAPSPGTLREGTPRFPSRRQRGDAARGMYHLQQAPGSVESTASVISNHAAVAPLRARVTHVTTRAAHVTAIRGRECRQRARHRKRSPLGQITNRGGFCSGRLVFPLGSMGLTGSYQPRGDYSSELGKGCARRAVADGRQGPPKGLTAADLKRRAEADEGGAYAEFQLRSM
jgi:hypothetical protein